MKARYNDNSHCIHNTLQSIDSSKKMEEFAGKMYPHLLVKTCFLGWKRVVDTEQNEYWEKFAQAKRFRRRYTCAWCVSESQYYTVTWCSNFIVSILFCRFRLAQLLGAWHRYVPQAKEERAKEKRRAVLRQKVASWLSDFVGKDEDSGDSDDESES